MEAIGEAEEDGAEQEPVGQLPGEMKEEEEGEGAGQRPRYSILEGGRQKRISIRETLRRSSRKSRMSISLGAALVLKSALGNSRRMSLRKSRQSGMTLDVDDFIQEEVSACSGFLADYMERCKAQFGTQVTGLAKKERQETARLIKILTQQQMSDIRGYEFATTAVCRERLRSQLMTGITKECKLRGMFVATGSSSFKHWCSYVWKCKRETMCLGVEVYNTLFRWKLLHTADPAVSESIWERKDRLEEFWSSFHDRSRVVDAFAAPGRHRPGPEGPRPLAAPAAAAAAASMGAGAYGMSWDFEQRGTHWKAVRGGASPAAQRLQQGRLPGLSGGASGSAAGVGMGAKSSSLPSLQKNRLVPEDAADAASRPGSGSGSKGRMVEQLPPIVASRQRYLQECDSRRRTPVPLTFVTGHSTEFRAAGKDLVDSELLAMAAMLQEMECVEEVDLYDNALLTDSGLVQFLKQLMRDPVKATLQRLKLGRCLRAGPYAIDATIKLLKAGGVLRLLDLSQVNIAARFQLPLCQAIGKHVCLETVCLAETGFQYHEMTKECLGALLSSKSVHTLDISWNCFNGEVFKSLGGFVIRNESLRSLRVANCAATLDTCPAQNFVSPLSRFLEQMSHDKTLTKLDISMNNCDFRTALILEDSLDTHRKLRELVLNHNPLGILGMRSLFRLLCRDHTGLMVFETDNCYVGETNEGGGLNSQVFSYTNPGGKYELQLWRPYHRALLRMLYKTMEGFNLKPEEAFERLSYKLGPKATNWVHPGKDSIGVWQVPEDGELTLVFSVEQAIFKRFMQGAATIEDGDFSGFLRLYYEEMRFRPGFKKVIPLFARWAELVGNPIAQNVYITSLSKDFNLTLSHLEHLCHACKSMTNDTIWRLLPCIPVDQASMFLAGHLFPKLVDFAWTHKLMQNLMNFNCQNPTGHYHLDLSNCSDYAVAERLLLLDRWEAALDRKLGRKDTSKLCNHSHIRNEVFQGRSLHLLFNSVAEWKMGEHGELELDYISNQRPDRRAMVLSDELWETILVEMHQSISNAEDKIAVLRSISHTFHLHAVHMRAMIGYFKTEKQRADVFIIFYLRIVDMHNAKMFQVRFENRHEVDRLQNRLGYATFFPFFQPENAKFELNLAMFDQRLCASMFVQLAIKEKFPQNLHDYGYKRADGTEDAMPLGVPRSWGDINAIPKEGVFRATYMCAPEDRQFSHRKEIAKTWGFLDVEGLTEDDVQWWTGLTEPPEDVINLLEFFISRYDNVEQPFLEIDGSDGNGCITLREFVESLDRIQCHKFDVKGQKSGPTKEQRIDAIFRYLDPGGEGSVSRAEWKLLDQLWKEFDLSIREFVHFLCLTFGDELLDAWDALDGDGSGELSEQEWLAAVVNIGYFGPAKVVFALLDSSDDGNISFDEFEVLEKYKPNKFHPQQP